MRKEDEYDRIERLGREMTHKWLLDRFVPGTLLDTNDARQAKKWQQFIGDYIGVPRLTAAKGSKFEVVGLELKTECEWTGNLFIETWAHQEATREERGWLYTLNCDYIVFAFLDVRCAVSVDFGKLRKWLLDDDCIWDCREVVVRRGHRKTVGRLVDIQPLIGLPPMPYLTKFDSSGRGDLCSLDDIWDVTAGERHANLEALGLATKRIEHAEVQGG